MARKTRKKRDRRPRSEQPATPRDTAPRPAGRPRRRDREPPPAPWGSFPLVEVMVLIAIVLVVAGFLTAGSQGLVMIGTGLLLGSLAGLELSLREHLAGYRSHNLVLAGFVAIVVLALLFILGPTGLSPGVRLIIGGGVFGLALWGFSEIFRRRSGGLSFKMTGFRR